MITSRFRNRWAARLAVGVALALLPAYLQAAGPAHKGLETNQTPSAEVVDMFRAIKEGKIDVKLIPKDSRQSNVLIENKAGKPLAVQLPDTFAGVPVLAQIGGVGGGGVGAGGGVNGGGQGIGGGFGGLGGFGGGVFNVAPEKVGKLRVTTVCLEHGKPEPRPAMKYDIKPIQEFTDKEEVRELCRMLASGQIDQRSAQAAAWHLNNDMTWQQLLAKQLRFANGTRQPYFHRAEIQQAMRAAAVARQVSQRRKQADPKESLSERNTIVD